MRQVQQLETPGETLGESPLDEERRGAEHHHAQAHAMARVFVPEMLDRFRPVRDLLHLVQREHGALLAGFLRQQASAFPLRGQPRPIAQRGLIGGDEDAGAVESSQNLLHERGLADLSRPGHYVQESSRLRQSAGQHGGVPTLESRAPGFTHLSA